jgi:hypothetical protein
LHAITPGKKYIEIARGERAQFFVCNNTEVALFCAHVVQRGLFIDKLCLWEMMKDKVDFSTTPKHTYETIMIKR